MGSSNTGRVIIIPNVQGLVAVDRPDIKCISEMHNLQKKLFFDKLYYFLWIDHEWKCLRRYFFVSKQLMSQILVFLVMLLFLSQKDPFNIGPEEYRSSKKHLMWVGIEKLCRFYLKYKMKVVFWRCIFCSDTKNRWTRQTNHYGITVFYSKVFFQSKLQFILPYLKSIGSRIPHFLLNITNFI